jgi:hypothetical protein
MAAATSRMMIGENPFWFIALIIGNQQRWTCVKILEARIRSLRLVCSRCRRFCDGQGFHVQHGSTIFNKERATGSISISYELQISITAAAGTPKPTHMVLHQEL